MLNLYFVRHGQTKSNIWHTLQGWSDTPLTELGIRQGRRLGRNLCHIPFLAIYYSSSQRALDTASYINAYQHLEMYESEGLKEMNFGTLEGKNPKNMEWQDLILYDWKKYGGESLDVLTNRIKRTMDDIVYAYRNQTGNILCVTHGFAILAAIRAVNSERFNQCLEQNDRINNCTVTVISYKNGNYMIQDVNTDKYLKKGGFDEEDY